MKTRGILSHPNLEGKYGPLDQNPSVGCQTHNATQNTYWHFASSEASEAMVKWLKWHPYVRKCKCLYSFNHDYIGKSKFYFFSSGKREKLKFWGASVGAKVWTFILGLKPYLLMGMRPRRSKWLGRSHNR